MFRSIFAVAVASAFAAPALGTVTVDIGVTTSGGSVANSLNITTTDYGWNGAQLLVQLTQGAVVNVAPGLGGVDYSPPLTIPFDTYVGRIGQSDQPSGGAVELGGVEPWSLGPAGINVDWFGSTGAQAPSNQLPIGNFVFSDDAQGTWSLKLSEPFLQPITFHGDLNDGRMDFGLEGDLTRDGFVGIEDLNNVLSYWNQSPPVFRPADYDPSRDNYVGIEDLNTVLGNWNAGTPQVPWPEGTSADLDGDGFVGIGDLNSIFVNWHQNVTPGDLNAGDPSGDGFVGFDDVVIVNTLWHTGTPPAVVPEPASLVILSLGASTLLRRKA